ncbi:MAG: STAS/SEC14 domain-containing protein [Planctomycetia bacterium]|nr:STAS/SEC14 domain-containing protein [Planctomycetia bacterium]
MSISLREEAGGKVLVIRLGGKLTKSDYERFVPEVERLGRRHGKVRLLIQMHDFHGWSMSAPWDDIRLDLKHLTCIERLGLVGESKWEAGMAAFCEPFTSATRCFFDEDKAGESLKWINGEIT